jgi:hypothetical protein
LVFGSEAAIPSILNAVFLAGLFLDCFVGVLDILFVGDDGGDVDRMGCECTNVFVGVKDLSESVGG